MLERPQIDEKAFRIGVYTFMVNSELEESVELSALLITAAETAPKPIAATQVGVRYCMTRGKTSRRSSVGIFSHFPLLKSVSDQSENTS